MKKDFLLKRSLLVLLTLFVALAGGGSSAWAQTTEQFTSTANEWPADWSLGGEATVTDYYVEYDSSNDYSYPSGRRGVYGQVSSGTTKYIITPVVNGSGSFKFKRRNSSNGSVYVYTYDNGVLSSSPIASNTTKPTSFTTVSFNGVDNMRLAIVLNGRMDDFVYTPGTESSCKKPSNLAASSITDESATITWDAGEADTWNLRYKAAGDADYTAVNGLNSATFDLTELDAATTYTVEVQTVCSQEEQSGWSSVEFTTPLCSPSVQKNITLTMWDTYGDGWNGNAAIQIVDEATSQEVGRFTVSNSASKSEVIVTQALCPNRTYTINWISGSYDSECRFTIKDVDGETIVDNSSSTPTSGKLTTYSWSNAPVAGAKFAINTDGTPQDFGVVAQNATAEKTFTVTNNGSAALSVNITTPTGFSVSPSTTINVAAGESGQFTISMNTVTTGVKSGNVTLAFDAVNDTSFTIPVSGVVMPAGATVIDFSDNSIPSGWTGSSWSFTNGYAQTSGYSAIYLTSPKLTFEDNNFFTFKVKASDSGSGDYVTVQGSTDGDSWTDIKNFTYNNGDFGNSSADFTTVVVSGISASYKYIRFKGYYVCIDDITGLSYAPSLSVTKEVVAVVSGSNYDFGECTANANVTYNFANAGAGTINITNVAITGEGAAAYSTNWTESVAAPFDLVITRAYDSSRAGAGAQDAVVTVTTSEGNFVINVTGTDKGANDPEFAVLIGEAEQTTGANLGFGTITANTVKTFKIQNAGTGALNITAVTMPDADYTTDLESAPTAQSPLVIAAGTTKTINVTLAASAKAIKSDKNIVISAEGFEDFTFVADATVMPGATIIDFNNNALPDGWTNNASNKWSFADGKAYCTAQSSSPAELVTKKLQFAADDFITISASSYDNYDNNFIEILGSTDNGETWTAFDAKKYISKSQIPYGSYATLTVTGIPNTVNKLKFRGYYVRIDEIAGLVYNANDPTLAVYSDAEATQAVATATTKDFGWAQSAQTATYYIKNGGTGTLTISDIDVPAGFTAATAGDAMTVAAGADLLALTVTMSAGAVGSKSGTITLTTDGGNFTIPVKGFIYGDRNLVDFTSASQYTGWTGVNVTDNAAALSSTAIQTTSLKATAGENLYVEIKGSSSYSSKSFNYSYSSDNGANWSDATALVESTYGNVADQVFTISDIAATDAVRTVLIRFTGSGLGINRIYGFEAIATPVMALDKTDDYNFGMQTAAAEYVITVTNNGTGDLKNLAANLTTGTDYSVEASKTTVAPTESATITITQKASTEYTSHSDVLTISADDVNDVVINLSGKTRDAAKYFADFEAAMPAGWTASGWSRTGNSSNYYAQAGYSGTNTLQTSALTIAAGEEIKYDAWVGYAGGTFKVRYTTNGGISWTEADVEPTTTQTTKTLSLGNETAVTAYIQFVGDYYARIDNFYGGTAAENAPLIQVKKNSTIVNNGEATEAFGSILAEATATYTITNAGSGTLTITEPITVSGGASAEVDATSLGAGESATLTITMPVENPYGEKSGVVTVKTCLGDFVINYTATTMDPDALNVDFSDNTLPAGWYKESGWNNYSQEIYRSDRNSDAYFMTQKLTVADTDDVLNFDAKQYGSYYASSTVLKVSYSTDRVNWTETDYTSELTSSYKTFSISGLAAGEYYLKFEGRYAAIDNIIGWKKVAGIEHDLYVTATSVPKTLAAEYTATATVTSLRAAEEGIYAKLFFGETEIATADAAAVALNGSTTFTMTATEAPTEGLYKAKIVVYYSDGTIAFTTGTTNVGTLVLDETKAYTAEAGSYGAVTLTRTFNVGWNTICLPFAMNSTQITTTFGADAKVFAFDNFDEGVLSFQKVTTLAAATPYLIYLPDAVSSPIAIENAVVSAEAQTITKGGVEFVGTYAPIAAPGMNGMWGVTAAGKIGKGNSTAFINGFRAYFNGNLAGARMAFFGEDETTGIQNLIPTLSEGEGAYNLQGQKVENLKKGQLYIKNGKKVVIK